MSYLALCRRAFITALGGAAVTMAVATICYLSVRPKDTHDFLECCHGLGASGIQSQLTNQTPEYLAELRNRLQQHGMWIEVMSGLPRTGNDGTFVRTIGSAKTVGALGVRSACLSGRRYETFATMDQWKKFVTQSHDSINWALPAAMRETKATRLAAMMRLVRTARKTKPIRYLSPLPKQAQWQLEEENVKLCLNYAREKMSL